MRVEDMGLKGLSELERRRLEREKLFKLFGATWIRESYKKIKKGGEEKCLLRKTLF